MVVIFMPFLPNLAVFLGISVWYLVPTYWIVVIYRFIESNLESNTEDTTGSDCKKILEKIILCDVQNEVYPNLEKIFINLLSSSGFPGIKLEKKIDFDKLYKERFN